MTTSTDAPKTIRPRRRELVTFVLVSVGLLTPIALAYVFVGRSTRVEPNYTRIDDRLYLGGAEETPPRGTVAVLNLCEFEDRYKVKFQKWAPIRDASPAPSLAWLKEMVDYVEAQQDAERKTYVHCVAGVSRSAMVVVAYYMRKNNWTRDEALAYVRERRPVIRPNAAFMALLLEWEASLAKR